MDSAAAAFGVGCALRLRTGASLMNSTPGSSTFTEPWIPSLLRLGVFSLVTVASKVSIELRKLGNGFGDAGTNINAMLADLKSLQSIFRTIEDSFEDLGARAPLTGYIGTHWAELKVILGDGCDSLEKLRTLLILANKDVRVLDDTRRALRLKDANDQIAIHRQEVQAYKDALQLSLQSVTFFQQATIKEETANY
ncbi:hypothetical protein CC86DRAFT_387871 [Ophiobolus disseminans]|uniref:Fungal N-terminal domain-containing protein n=1 Tax=Ophiobolus disseminans TaxID=1469910 RepID=A0A6A6ZG33_9PLEO|nr:hypothetical protein CC86DRAFT_387871 [Ophiobolus disseminans]